MEPIVHIQRHLDNLKIIDLRANAVHSVCGRASKNLVLSRYTEAAQQRINCLVGANADEEVLGAERLLSVVVGIAEIAE